MLPNTSVIGAPSMRMRVGSLIDTMASTDTPSLASTICSAWAGTGVKAKTAAVAAIAALIAHPCRSTRTNRCGDRAWVGSVAGMGYLLETLQMHARTGVAELDPVGLEVVGGLEAVDRSEERR